MVCKFKTIGTEGKISFLALMFLHIFIFLSLFCVMSSASEAYSSGTSEVTPVRVGVIHYPDDVYVPGQFLYNYDTEFMGRVSQFAKWDPRFVFYSNRTELLNALKAGKIQIALGVDKEWGNEDQLIYSDGPYFVGTSQIVVPDTEKRLDASDFRLVERMRIGVSGNEGYIRFIKAWGKRNNLNLHLVAFPDDRTLRIAMADHKVDAAIFDKLPRTGYRRIVAGLPKMLFAVFPADGQQLARHFNYAMWMTAAHYPLLQLQFYGKYNQEENHALSLTPSEKAYLMAHRDKPFIVAVVHGDYPFYYRDYGVDSGIIPEFYREIEMSLREQVPGISFAYKEYSSNGTAVDAVRKGEADILGMTSMDVLHASAEDIHLSTPFMVENLAMLSQEEPVGEKDFQYDRKVPVIAVTEEDLNAVYAYAGRKYKIKTYPNYEEAYQALINREADYVVATMAQATWLMNQHRNGRFIVHIIPSTQNISLCGGVSEKNWILADILSETADSTGTNLLSIVQKNIAPQSDFATFLQRMSPESMLIIAALLMTGVCGGAFLIIRNIRGQEVQKRNEMLINSQRRVIYAYEYDGLTGLLNRDTAMSRFEKILLDSPAYSVVIIDLDNFRIINESYGHETGDVVLKVISGRIRNICQQDAMNRFVARYSGDEFLLVVNNRKLTAADALIREVVASCNQPIPLKELMEAENTLPGDKVESLVTYLGVGIAASDGKSSFRRLVQNAVVAINTAKKAGSNSVCVYEEAMQEDVHRNNRIRDFLLDAMKNDGFYMVYQPQVDIQKGTVSGTEALVRLKKEQISPGLFIQVAEKEGFIRRIGRITTRLVIEQIVRWREAGEPLYPVSINYSSSQLGDAGYVDYLLGLMKKNHIPSSLIKLEFTESMFFNNNHVTKQLLKKLQDAGISLSLDDFGTGYSSLKYLTYIPVDYLKLDKSIIDSYLTEEAHEKEYFIRDIISLAHDLGKKIVVEGVETAWQAKRLKSFGCDIIQGYYYSRPISPEEIATFTVRTED